MADLHQGQLCKLSRKSDDFDMGVYAKIRNDEGRQVYVKIFGDNEIIDDQTCKQAESLIPCDKVDTGSNKGDMAERPYTVSLIIPASAYQRIVVLNSKIDIDSEIRKSSVYIDIDNARRDILSTMKYIESRMESYNVLREELDDCKRRMNELDLIDRSVDSIPSPMFTYVYGKHSENGIEYCWRVPFHLENKILVGMKLIGNTTSRGKQPFTVTRIEHSNRLLKHQTVVSICDENAGEDQYHE